MNTKKKMMWQRLLLYLFSFYPLMVWSQSDKIINKWSIGVGYDFLHERKVLFQQQAINVSVKYSLTDKHSFYLTVPLYFENNREEQKNFELTVYSDPLYWRIWGIGAGYNYTIYTWKGLSGFAGFGFDFKKETYRFRNYYYDLNDGTETFVDEGKNNSAYGLSPQIGLSYRFKHVECELKYKYSATFVRRHFLAENRDELTIADYVDHCFLNRQDLVLSLYYCF